MAYGKIKADAIIRDNSGSDEEITMATIVGLDTNKAPKASPTFTGTVNLPATTNFAGASTLEILDNNANAFGVDEGTNNYVNFDTTNGAEQIEVAKNVELAANLEFTASADVKIRDNQATAFQIKQGTNDYVTFDTTDGSEQIEVAKKVQLAEDLEFSAAKDILITDNSGTALEVKEGTTSYMTFDTTNSAEQVEVNVPLVLNNTTELRLGDTDSSNYIALKAPDTVSSNVTLKFPADDGDANEFLQTNGSGVLSWAAAGGKIRGFNSYRLNTRVSTSDSSNVFREWFNVTYNKQATDSVIWIWGLTQGFGQQSGGGNMQIKLGNTAHRARCGNMTYPGGNYGVAINWGTTFYSGDNTETGNITVRFGHLNRDGGKPISIVHPNSGDHGSFQTSSGGNTGSNIFILELAP